MTMERAPLFDRQYDFEAGTSVITSADGATVFGNVDLSTVAEASLKRFALAGITNYIINNATSTAKRKENKLTFAEGIAQALERVISGNVNVGAVGLGDTTAAGLLGRALLALGKDKIEFAGKAWAFNDEDSAKVAAKALYDCKDKVTFKTQGGGSKVLTGRQFFNALTEQSVVASKIAELRSNKEIDLGIEF